MENQRKLNFKKWPILIQMSLLLIIVMIIADFIAGSSKHGLIISNNKIFSLEAYIQVRPRPWNLSEANRIEYEDLPHQEVSK